MAGLVGWAWLGGWAGLGGWSGLVRWTGWIVSLDWLDGWYGLVGWAGYGSMDLVAWQMWVYGKNYWFGTLAAVASWEGTQFSSPGIIFGATVRFLVEILRNCVTETPRRGWIHFTTLDDRQKPPSLSRSIQIDWISQSSSKHIQPHPPNCTHSVESPLHC